MSRILLMVSLATCFWQLQAQHLRVLEDKTRRPIEGAVVLLREKGVSQVSDSDGLVFLKQLQKGDSLLVRHISYEPLAFSWMENAKDTLEIFLTPISITLNELVVSALKWNRDRSSINARIAKITEPEMRLMQPQTAADMLGLTGEVFIQKSQQGGGSPMIRGFAANRVLIVVDGVRMNNAIFRSGNLQNVISIDPYATEDAEVLFGPESSIYGSDAIGGIMHFHSLEAPTDQSGWKGQFAGRYATANDERSWHAHVGWSGDRWSFVSSVSRNDYGSMTMGSNGPEDYLRETYVRRQDDTDLVLENSDKQRQRPSAFDQWHTMHKVNYRPGRHWKASYAFFWSETSPYGRYDRHLRTRDGLPRYGEWNYGPQQWSMHRLSLHHQKSSKLYDQWRLAVARQNFGESRITRNFQSPLRTTRIEDVEAWSVNLDARKTFLKDWAINYGLEFLYNDVRSKGELRHIGTGNTMKGAPRYPDAEWQSVAAYATASKNWNAHWSVDASLRYNLFDLKARFDTSLFTLPFDRANLTNNALSGSLSVNWKKEGWRVYGSVSSGFRSPNVDDIGKIFDSEPGAVVVPNPGLSPEYAWNFELGVDWQTNDWMQWQWTAYYTLLDGALVRRDFQLDGRDSIDYDGVLSKVQAIQNAAQEVIVGTQLSAVLGRQEGWQFSVIATLQDGVAELDDGSESASRHVVPFFGQARLRYAKKQWTGLIYSQFQGQIAYDDLAVSERNKTEIYAANDQGLPYAPAWWTLNVKWDYELQPGWYLSLGVENVLDKRYRPYSSGLAGPGRNLVVATQWNW